MPTYSFECPGCDIVFDKFLPMNHGEVLCDNCGEAAHKIILSVNFKLDGTDPGFPTAYERWAKEHERRAKE